MDINQKAAIIKENIEKIIGEKEGDLGYALSADPESIGARSWKGFPCYGASFTYDGLTGKILFFGNTRLQPEWTKKNPGATFSFIRNTTPQERRDRILEVLCKDEESAMRNRVMKVGRIYQVAFDVLEATQHIYNELFAFDPEK